MVPIPAFDFLQGCMDFKQVFLFRRQDQGRGKSKTEIIRGDCLIFAGGGLSLEFLKIIFKPDSGKKE